RKIPIGLIHTMGIPEEMLHQGPNPCGQNLGVIEDAANMIFGHGESLYCFDTLQFDDYGKFEASRFDAAAKAKRHREIFPLDCEKAFAMGALFADMTL
ncbi:MAG: flavodoxin family protein, partial [Planctomycetota bacterium]|nr:flavodoxin family protein [Planctomycetota bacterium]